jgi:hypothetical protein
MPSYERESSSTGPCTNTSTHQHQRKLIDCSKLLRQAPFRSSLGDGWYVIPTDFGAVTAIDSPRQIPCRAVDRVLAVTDHIMSTTPAVTKRNRVATGIVVNATIPQHHLPSSCLWSPVRC